MKAAEPITPERAAELTASCSEVQHNWQAAPEARWCAVHWCNARGQSLAATGPTALAAVLAVHALVDTENARV